MKCKECEKRDVKIKKHKLCLPCYQRMRSEARRNRDTFYSHSAKQRIRFPNEMVFVRNFFDHKNWIYVPATFNLGCKTYTPDFYDGERDVFIEVAGTAQAFYNNRESYRSFVLAYPKIKFEVRLPDGQLIDIEEPHIAFKQNTLSKLICKDSDL